MNATILEAFTRWHRLDELLAGQPPHLAGLPQQIIMKIIVEHILV